MASWAWPLHFNRFVLCEVLSWLLALRTLGITLGCFVVNYHLKEKLARTLERRIMPTSTEFLCKCGKLKGWITDGETKKIPCPACGRIYKGVYNKNNLTIDAVEVAPTAKESA